jgi:hypothetical protein
MLPWNRATFFILTRFVVANRRPPLENAMVRPHPKIAVNAVGCNEAISILFRHGIIAE